MATAAPITRNRLHGNFRDEIQRDPRLASYHTQRGYIADLAAFDQWRNGRELSRLLVEGYAAELQGQGFSPNTINRRLAAVRWLARRTAEIMADMPANTIVERQQRAEFIAHAERVASVADVRGYRQPKGRAINPGELAALMQACAKDPTPAGRRDAAMIALAWSTGARREEIASLTLADITTTGDHETEIKIKGKGNKERTAYIVNGAFHALADWLATWRQEDNQGHLFSAINKGGRILGHKLTGEAMRGILNKRIKQASVSDLTWHDFRRSFAGELLDAGSDLVTVQKLMGHVDPNTTASYDRRGAEVQRKAIKALHVPYYGQS